MPLAEAAFSATIWPHHRLIQPTVRRISTDPDRFGFYRLRQPIPLLFAMHITTWLSCFVMLGDRQMGEKVMRDHATG